MLSASISYDYELAEGLEDLEEDELWQAVGADGGYVQPTSKRYKSTKLVSTKYFRLVPETPFKLPSLPEQDVFQHQLHDDLIFITQQLCTFAVTTFNSSATPSLPIRANSAWSISAQRFFIDVERIGPARLADSLLARMSREVRVLLGKRDYTAKDLATLPSGDLIKGGIYVDIIHGIDTSVDDRFIKSSGVYTGSGTRLATRLTKYKNVKDQGQGSNDRESRRTHLLAAASSETTSMDPRPLIIFRDNEVATPLFAVSEGLIMVLLRTVHDTGFRNTWVTDESIQLFQHCVPPTLPSPSYQGLNTVWAMKQGIPKLRSQKVTCCNIHCGVTREEKDTVFHYAKADGLPLGSYWCRVCALYYYNYGDIRPRSVILKKSTPEPSSCPICSVEKNPTDRDWCWDYSVDYWYCSNCYKDAHKVPGIQTVVSDSHPKPAVCPGCLRRPENFPGNRGWTFDHGFKKWWCFGCRPSKGSKLGLRRVQKKMTSQRTALTAVGPRRPRVTHFNSAGSKSRTSGLAAYAVGTSIKERRRDRCLRRSRGPSRSARPRRSDVLPCLRARISMASPPHFSCYAKATSSSISCL